MAAQLWEMFTTSEKRRLNLFCHGCIKWHICFCHCPKVVLTDQKRFPPSVGFGVWSWSLVSVYLSFLGFTDWALNNNGAAGQTWPRCLRVAGKNRTGSGLSQFSESVYLTLAVSRISFGGGFQWILKSGVMGQTWTFLYNLWNYCIVFLFEMVYAKIKRFRVLATIWSRIKPILVFLSLILFKNIPALDWEDWLQLQYTQWPTEGAPTALNPRATENW